MLRSFVDDDGVEWRVWNTVPSPHYSISEQLRTGWLTFDREEERRRLSPIPPSWGGASDVQLRDWCREAVRVPKTGLTAWHAYD